MELASRPQDAIRLAERALFVLTIQMVQHERRENATKTVALIRKRPCHPRSDLESKTLVARFGCRKPKNLQIAVDTVDVGGRRSLAYEQHERAGSTSQIQDAIASFDPGELNEASLESPLRHRPAKQWIVEPIQPAVPERRDEPLSQHRRCRYARAGAGRRPTSCTT
ncbi:MAG: hypothetical protein AUJ01_16540 [Acidobacteria bacterium 13_1_40CM_3_65_5]|nr:MAG: hypothetical protein AUJ01_16540 [Acidobacteria bacterium 13_1_40CM_3_65_5]